MIILNRSNFKLDVNVVKKDKKDIKPGDIL